MFALLRRRWQPAAARLGSFRRHTPALVQFFDVHTQRKRDVPEQVALRRFLLRYHPDFFQHSRTAQELNGKAVSFVKTMVDGLQPSKPVTNFKTVQDLERLFGVNITENNGMVKMSVPVWDADATAATDDGSRQQSIDPLRLSLSIPSAWFPSLWLETVPSVASLYDIGEPDAAGGGKHDQCARIIASQLEFFLRTGKPAPLSMVFRLLVENAEELDDDSTLEGMTPEEIQLYFMQQMEREQGRHAVYASKKSQRNAAETGNRGVVTRLVKADLVYFGNELEDPARKKCLTLLMQCSNLDALLRCVHIPIIVFKESAAAAPNAVDNVSTGIVLRKEKRPLLVVDPAMTHASFEDMVSEYLQRDSDIPIPSIDVATSRDAMSSTPSGRRGASDVLYGAFGVVDVDVLLDDDDVHLARWLDGAKSALDGKKGASMRASWKAANAAHCRIRLTRFDGPPLRLMCGPDGPAHLDVNVDYGLESVHRSLSSGDNGVSYADLSGFSRLCALHDGIRRVQRGLEHSLTGCHVRIAPVACDEAIAKPACDCLPSSGDDIAAYYSAAYHGLTVLQDEDFVLRRYRWRGVTLELVPDLLDAWDGMDDESYGAMRDFFSRAIQSPNDVGSPHAGHDDDVVITEDEEGAIFACTPTAVVRVEDGAISSVSVVPFVDVHDVVRALEAAGEFV